MSRQAEWYFLCFLPLAKEEIEMITGYNKDPFHYEWKKLFQNCFWLFMLLVVLATVIKTLTEH